MSKEELMVSLVVPTNGVIEWVFPVLDSIYQDEPDHGRFEVIVTDNGDNEEFQRQMESYCARYDNLIYRKTQAKQFLNQVEAFKLASGRLIKFVNHRMKLLPGTVEELIRFAASHEDTKPGIYFMNGAIAGKNGEEKFDSFDAYVAGMRRFSSWSAGTTMWKEDFDRLDPDMTYNATFPHIDYVFSEKNKAEYIIDHRVLFEEIPVDDTKKGKYDLFHAFGVEYPGLMLDLCRRGEISKETFLTVKEDMLRLLAELYFGYVLRKMPCSYDLSGYKSSIPVFFSNGAVWRMMVRIGFGKIFGRRG